MRNTTIEEQEKCFNAQVLQIYFVYTSRYHDRETVLCLYKLAKLVPREHQKFNIPFMFFIIQSKKFLSSVAPEY